MSIRPRYLLDNDGYETVIALTDVYTGTNDFADAADAKRKMSQWVGDEPRFFPHVALHDFEAWLIPFWPRIKERSGTDSRPSQANPEAINHSTPPSKFLSQIYRTGSKKRDYVKVREAKAILEGQDLDVAIAACLELRALIRTNRHSGLPARVGFVIHRFPDSLIWSFLWPPNATSFLRNNGFGSAR